jgi:DNA-binding response OmpR family regulator
MKCPACGQDVGSASDKPTVSLDDNMLIFRGQKVTILGRMAEILSAMAAAMPRTATRSYLIERVWGVMEREATAENLSVHIARIRRVLPPGLEITTVRGVGFRLEVVEPLVSHDDAALFFRGQKISLAGRRAKILLALAAVMPRTATRSYLVERVWGATQRESTFRNLDVHISCIRRSLPSKLRIKTSVGRGYRLEIRE